MAARVVHVSDEVDAAFWRGPAHARAVAYVCLPAALPDLGRALADDALDEAVVVASGAMAAEVVAAYHLRAGGLLAFASSAFVARADAVAEFEAAITGARAIARRFASDRLARR